MRAGLAAIGRGQAMPPSPRAGAHGCRWGGRGQGPRGGKAPETGIPGVRAQAGDDRHGRAAGKVSRRFFCMYVRYNTGTYNFCGVFLL